MNFWSFWYFHIPNFVLAALMYTLIGRLVLGIFVPEDWDNYIWRFFRKVTDPAVRVVRYVTPSVFTHVVTIVFAILWLMAIRILYFVALADAGLAPVARQGG